MYLIKIVSLYRRKEFIKVSSYTERHPKPHSDETYRRFVLDALIYYQNGLMFKMNEILATAAILDFSRSIPDFVSAAQTNLPFMPRIQLCSILFSPIISVLFRASTTRWLFGTVLEVNF